MVKMMESVKCIYCGRGVSDGIELSESDIIPDALTNAKIRFKNVCRIDHNNKFSDLFESRVIEEFSYIRNRFNIKGKNKVYPFVNKTIKFQGKSYIVKTRDKKSVFGKKIVKSECGNFLMGPLEELRKKNKYKNIEQVDINEIEHEEEFIFNTGICVSSEMYRLVAKIAYEWYCKINNINDKKEIFTEIIDYITTGRYRDQNELVSIILDNELYVILSSKCINGSHFLACYIDECETCCVLVSIFGIVAYKIKLFKVSDYNNYKYNFFEELSVTGEKKKVLDSALKDEDIGLVIEDIKNFLKIENQVFMAGLKRHLNTIDYIDYKDNVKILVDIISNNLKNVLSYSTIDRKVLQRFVDEYNLIDHLNINDKSLNPEFWFLFYIVYLIGDSKNESINIHIVNELVVAKYDKVFNGEYGSNKNNIIKLKEVIYSNENYREVINRGAKLIKLFFE